MKPNLIILSGLIAVATLSSSAADKIGGTVTVNGQERSVEGKTCWGPETHRLIMGGHGTSMLSTTMLTPQAVNDETLPRMRPPVKVSATGAHIQGHLKASSSADYPNGWWDVNTNGEVNLLFASTAMMGQCGFVRDDKICQFTTIQSYGYYWFYYSEYSLADGTELFEIELPDNDFRNYVINCAYDSTEDKVYLQSYNKVRGALAWSSFDPVTHEREYINNDMDWTANRVIASGWNPRDGKVYGISESGDFVTLDKATGFATRIAKLPVDAATYSQSMVYSPLDRGFVWAAMYADNTSGFALINPTDGAYTPLGQMAAQNEFVQLYCYDKDYADVAPAIVDNVSTTFDGPSLSGTYSFTMPTTAFDGTPLEASTQLKANIGLDGATITTLQGAPGATVTGQLTTTQGEHTLQVSALLGTSEGPVRVSTFYAGHDNPCAPTDVTIEGNTISWTAPTQGAHNGYLDTSALRYNVWLGQTLITQQPVTATSITFEAPTSLGIYVARVEATAHDMISEPGESRGVRFGEIFDMPFHFIPTPEEFALCTVTDANHDGVTWQIFAERKKFYYNSPRDGGADDWLFFPKAHFLSGEALYLIDMNMQALLASCPENLEIWLCKTQNPNDPDKVKIGEFQNYIKDAWTRERVKFPIADAGDYCLAFRVTSTDGFMLSLQDITVSQTTDTKHAPADCKGVNIVAGEQGALQATISFMAPVKDIAGNTLDLTREITVHAASGVGESSVNVFPGKNASITVPTVQGLNPITITPQNEGGYGIERKYEIFTGVEKPGPVRNVKTDISPDGLTLSLRWDAPNIGENGGYIDPEKVKYQIYTAGDEMWMFREDIGDAREYAWTIPAGSQSLQQVAVAGYNEAGTTSTANFKGAARIMGTPLQMPVVETFGYGIPDHLPILITKPSAQHTTEWAMGDPTAIAYGAITSDWGCIYNHATQSGESFGRIELPIVSTLGYNNATFRINPYHMPKSGIVHVLAKSTGDTSYTEIGSVDTSVGQPSYVQEDFRLPAELQNRPWVAFAIEVEYTAGSTSSYTIIDDYCVVDLPDLDMMAEMISAPANVRPGQEAHYEAMAYNNGRYTLMANAIWEVLRGDQVIATAADLVSPLDPEESETLNFTYVPTPDLAGENLTVRLRLEAEGDDAPANDVAQCMLQVRTLGVPVVDNVTGTYDEENEQVTLTWDAPAAGRCTTDDLEAMDDGAYTPALGNWINLDVDGKDLIGIANSTITDAGAPKGWQVLDTTTAGLGAFAANSGSKILMALAPSDGSMSNDWLVSPTVQGGSTLEFAVCSLSSAYAETFEVLASEGGTEPADFTPVARLTKEEFGWEIYSVLLPREATRFAIRYCSVDQFGMMLDDITYVPADAEPQTISGYNVYRDGEKKAEGLIATTHVDADVARNTQYLYHVTTLVSDTQGALTEGARSPQLSLFTTWTGVGSITTDGRVETAAGEVIFHDLADCKYSICTLDGRIAASGIAAGHRHSVMLAPGIYVVNVGQYALKVIVRN